MDQCFIDSKAFPTYFQFLIFILEVCSFCKTLEEWENNFSQLAHCADRVSGAEQTGVADATAVGPGLCSISSVEQTNSSVRE